MPNSPNYPGVYVEEVSGGVRPVVGAPTSVTAFVGRTLRGPANVPKKVCDYDEFTRVFGGLWQESPLSYSVKHFFENGGAEALIVRVHNGASRSKVALPSAMDDKFLRLAAANEGEWGNSLRVQVEDQTEDPANAMSFHLRLSQLDAKGVPVAGEDFRNVSADRKDDRYVVDVLKRESNLAVVTGVDEDKMAIPSAASTSFTGGDDGAAVTGTQAIGTEILKAGILKVGAVGTQSTESEDSASEAVQTEEPEANNSGIYALRDADIFNLLWIPPFSPSTEVDCATWKAAAKLCQDERAFLIVDAGRAWRVSDAGENAEALRSQIGDNRRNAGLYFPWITAPDPLRKGQLGEFAPGGVVAGVMARTDAQRGVWKAAAGLEAALVSVSGLTVEVTDRGSDVLNPLGINCLRTFSGAGHVVWGARTLDGADRLASEWKYVPVRRLALFVEESLCPGTEWVVFEPNDEQLWRQIRFQVAAFLQALFQQGAFQGTSADEAYFVRCDSETTTQDDVDKGVVNILVGFAPLKPAEFVVVQIQQKAESTSV